MDFPDFAPIFPTIILAIIAFYGAVLSTINFVKDWQREKPKIIVDIYWDWDEEDWGGPVLRAIARNKGSKTVTLDYIDIEEFVRPKRLWRVFPVKGKGKYSQKARFGVKSQNELSSGKCYEFVIDDDTLGTEHGISNRMDLIVTFVDQIGNRYQSKPLMA